MNESTNAKPSLKEMLAIELNGIPGHIAAALYAILCPFWVVSLIALPYCLMAGVNPKDLGTILGIYEGNFYFYLLPIWFTFAMFFVFIGRTVKHKFIKAYNSYVLPPMIVLAFFTFLFAGVVFPNFNGSIYPFGEKTIAWCDYTQQGVPYLMHFKSILEGNDSLLLNMSNAGGMNAWSLLRSMFIYPLNYLVLFVDNKEMMQFSTVLTVTKLATCSLTAMIFFRNCCKKLDIIFAIPLSLMYSFCAYGAMYYQIVTWPDTMYVLPLVFTGLFLLIEKGNIAVFAFSLSIFISNISHGFMLVITIVILMTGYLMTIKDTDKIKKICFNFASGTMFAVFLSSPFWISFFGSFGDSARGVDVKSTIEASAFLTNKYTVYPLLLSTVFIFIGVCWLVSHSKKTPMQKSLLITFGLMIIPMVVEPINKMWHAGSYMAFPARFGFILTFIGLIICAYALSKDEDDIPPLQETNKYLRYTGMAIVGIVLFIVVGYLSKFTGDYVATYWKDMSTYASTLWAKEKSYKHILKLALLFLAMYGIGYVAYKKHYLNKRLFAIILTFLVLSEAFVTINIYMVSASTKVNTENFQNYADLGGKIEDDDFYRVKNNAHLFAAYTTSESNFPGAIGYNSTGHYSSLASEEYLYAIKALGYSSMWMKIETYGGTEFSDALLSIKYQLDRKDNSKEALYSNTKYAIYESPYYLPMGILCEGDDFELDIMTMERSEMQQKIFETITGTNDKLIIDYTPTKFTGCSHKLDKDDKHVLKGEGGQITYTIDVIGEQTLYFDCYDGYSNGLTEDVNGSFSVKIQSASINGNVTKYPSSDYNRTNGFLKLGEFSNEKVTVILTLKKDITCRSFNLFGLDHSTLQDCINNTNGSDLNFDGDDVSGSITAEKDGWMFISLPYSTNLVYEVNGKQVSAQKAFYGFTAIPVKAGENSIYIHSQAGILTWAIVLTIITLIAAIVLYTIMRKRKISMSIGFGDKLEALCGPKISGAKSIISSITWVGIIVAFFIIIAFIYIYPIYTLLATQV